MSVINQVLLDLEKRRASPSERGMVPDHVRALPDSGRSSHWPWIVGGGAAVLATAAAAAWMVLGGSGTVPASPPAPRSGAETAIDQVVTTSAGVTPAERATTPAFQLTFELSNVPAETMPAREALTDKAGTRTPLPTARIVDRPAAEPAAESATIARTDRPAVVAAAKPDGSSVQQDIKKQVRQPSARELAENEYRKGATLLHQGRLAEAQQEFEAALSHFPGYHGARQALVALLVEAKRPGDAERLLQEGLALAPSQIGFAMALARLQVDRGDAALAAATLRKSYEYAQGSPDYIAFLAALLQRQGRHEEAIEQFQAALRLRPTSGVWWLGLGISLQAINRTADAQDAYRRARTTNNLTPELAAFAEQRLRQLQ
jgi:MSHA biogenesis protein MshN